MTPSNCLLDCSLSGVMTSCEINTIPVLLSINNTTKQSLWNYHVIIETIFCQFCTNISMDFKDTMKTNIRLFFMGRRLKAYSASWYDVMWCDIFCMKGKETCLLVIFLCMRGEEFTSKTLCKKKCIPVIIEEIDGSKGHLSCYTMLWLCLLVFPLFVWPVKKSEKWRKGGKVILNTLI